MAMTTTLPAKTVGRSVIPLAEKIEKVRLTPDKVLNVSKITTTGSQVTIINRPTTSASSKYGGLELPIVSVDLEHFIMAMDQLPGGRDAWADEIEAARINFANPRRSPKAQGSPKSQKSPAILPVPKCTTCPTPLAQSILIPTTKGPAKIPQSRPGFVAPTIPSLLPIPKVTTPQAQVMTSQVMIPPLMTPQPQLMTPQPQLMTPQHQVMTPSIMKPMAVPMSVVKPLPAIMKPSAQSVATPSLAPLPIITPLGAVQPVIRPMIQPAMRPGGQIAVPPMMVPTTPQPQPQRSVVPLAPMKSSSGSMFNDLLMIGAGGKSVGKKLEFSDDSDEEIEEDQSEDEDEDEY
jgi:hypothetical protein